MQIEVKADVFPINTCMTTEVGKSQELSMCKAFNRYCRHNDENPDKIHNLRKKGHWFKVISSPGRVFNKNDIILVSLGYLTNVTQGWTIDALPQKVRISHKTEEWGVNYCSFAADVTVIPMEKNEIIYS